MGIYSIYWYLSPYAMMSSSKNNNKIPASIFLLNEQSNTTHLPLTSSPLSTWLGIVVLNLRGLMLIILLLLGIEMQNLGISICILFSLIVIGRGCRLLLKNYQRMLLMKKDVLINR
jgi:hypothetical protein